MGVRLMDTAALPDYVAVRKVLVCSTAHVSPETRDWLNEQGLRTAMVYQRSPKDFDAWPDIPIMSSVYGWQFYAQEDPDFSLPHEVLELMKLAREREADWVELDSDGDVIYGLPTWEW
jgi:hypothetical protein